MEGDDPLTTALAIQRRMLEASNDAVRRSLQFQRSVNEALVEGVDRQQEFGERGAATTRDALHASLDAIEATLPGDVQGIDEVCRAVDRQYEAATDAGEGASQTAKVAIEGGEALSATSVEALEAQIDAFEDAHADFETQIRTVIEETDARLDDLRASAEGKLEDRLATFDERIQELRVRLEE